MHKKDDEEIDFEDIEMDNVPTLSEQAEADLIRFNQLEEAKLITEALEEQAALAPKTEQEIMADQIHQLLDSARLSSWERGFCESTSAYLANHPNNKLSYKQKDVLAKMVNKYFS